MSDTRTYASITRPLSRMMSITSARPLGRGRSMYPRGVVAMLMRPLLARTALVSLLAGLLGRQGLLRLLHQAAPDEGAVLRQGLGDVGLADPVQVADRPVELLQRVLRRAPVAIGLVLLAVRLAVVTGHLDPPCRLAAA